MSQLTAYLRTKKRTEYIQNTMKDHKVVEMWEHTWDLLSKENEQVQKFIIDYPVVKSIKLRDALFGG